MIQRELAAFYTIVHECAVFRYYLAESAKSSSEQPFGQWKYLQIPSQKEILVLSNV